MSMADDDRIPGTGVDPASCALLPAVLAANGETADFLVLSRESDSAVRLYTSIREMVRVDPAAVN